MSFFFNLCTDDVQQNLILKSNLVQWKQQIKHEKKCEKAHLLSLKRTKKDNDN